jgi:hypothetical protein
MALPAKRLFTVDEHYGMAEVGILREDERVELIEGEILELGRTSPWHARRTDWLAHLFILRLRDATQVHIKNPVRLSSRSEPVPGLALLRSHPDRDGPHRLAYPTPSDVQMQQTWPELQFIRLQYRRHKAYADGGPVAMLAGFAGTLFRQATLDDIDRALLLLAGSIASFVVVSVVYALVLARQGWPGARLRMLIGVVGGLALLVLGLLTAVIAVALLATVLSLLVVITVLACLGFAAWLLRRHLNRPAVTTTTEGTEQTP